MSELVDEGASVCGFEDADGGGAGLEVERGVSRGRVAEGGSDAISEDVSRVAVAEEVRLHE